MDSVEVLEGEIQAAVDVLKGQRSRLYVMAGCGPGISLERVLGRVRKGNPVVSKFIVTRQKVRELQLSLHQAKMTAWRMELAEIGVEGDECIS